MPIADYAHHNEDAERIWWQEEGKHYGHEDPPDPDYEDLPDDEDVCEWCGEVGTDANPLDFHVVSPPVSGFKFRQEYLHAACATERADGMVK